MKAAKTAQCTAIQRVNSEEELITFSIIPEGEDAPENFFILHRPEDRTIHYTLDQKTTVLSVLNHKENFHKITRDNAWVTDLFAAFKEARKVSRKDEDILACEYQLQKLPNGNFIYVYTRMPTASEAASDTSERTPPAPEASTTKAPENSTFALDCLYALGLLGGAGLCVAGIMAPSLLLCGLGAAMMVGSAAGFFYTHGFFGVDAESADVPRDNRQPNFA